MNKYMIGALARMLPATCGGKQSEAFGVQQGDALDLPPEQHVRIR